MADENMIAVEVAYALPDNQKIVPVMVPEGSTAIEAAKLSGIDKIFDGIDIDNSDMGVFGKSVKPTIHVMQAGERIEIYRPLLIDPKEVRKKRAEKAAKEKKSS
ncbi:MAG: putative ubiquitin-RnfH superfamily antitoxin RatB of RatAB toxin-antitoxin module [Flavobacteriales bacterium]|jgi:putative ubiquitin-RnfH superfamily antitoxin RatB of RatAB toxin-antitoxin module|tara:strand:+ start:4487 stop:4798 length:312 start_codon:yes stop_codon:yes gene_type:complete